MSSLNAGSETLVIGTAKCKCGCEKIRRKELMRMRKDDVISQNENEKRRKLDREREREREGLERERMQEEDNLSRERELRDRREVINRKHALLESKFQATMKKYATADGYSYQNCVVCTNTIGKLFALRCGHTSTCAKCLKQLDACPMCFVRHYRTLRC